ITEVLIPWIELWSGGLHDAGIAVDRIHTHIALLGSADYAGAAFNAASTPGFSIYTLTNFTSWYTALDQLGDPPWGISEGSPANPLGGPRTGTIEQFLAKAYNHGATFVNLYQWVVAEH